MQFEPVGMHDHIDAFGCVSENRSFAGDTTLLR
jgi:hypothetical protein